MNLSSLALRDFQDNRAGLGALRTAVEGQPTLTQPNEPLTLELVAELLAEQLGDECACNLNGNDEWLPLLCQYDDDCPSPPERLGCWMEFLRNRNRRPPEGEEEPQCVTTNG